jgi:hypothetical protein
MKLHNQVQMYIPFLWMKLHIYVGTYFRNYLTLDKTRYNSDVIYKSSGLFSQMAKHLRPIPNFTPAPGVKFVPYGEYSPLRSPPEVNTLHYLEEWRGKQRFSSPRDSFTPRGQNLEAGQLRPRGQSLPLGAKLRIGLWSHCLPSWTAVDDFLCQLRGQEQLQLQSGRLVRRPVLRLRQVCRHLQELRQSDGRSVRVGREVAAD